MLLQVVFTDYINNDFKNITDHIKLVTCMVQLPRPILIGYLDSSIFGDKFFMSLTKIV